MIRIWFLVLTAISIACDSPGKKKPTLDGTTLNLGGSSTLEFYSAAGLGVSAIRYIVRPAAGTVTKMVPDDADGLKEEKVVTLSEAQKSSVIAPLSSLTRQTWGACASCTSGEKTLWVDVSGEDRFYFAQEGNCSCPNSEFVPSLDYSQMDGIYQSILGLFEE